MKMGGLQLLTIIILYFFFLKIRKGAGILMEVSVVSGLLRIKEFRKMPLFK